jgi:hypothetical protein
MKKIDAFDDMVFSVYGHAIALNDSSGLFHELMFSVK